MSKRILVLGASGMLGGSIFRFLSNIDEHEVLGTVRSGVVANALCKQGFSNLVSEIDATRFGDVEELILKFRPNILINCIGLIKQLESSRVPSLAITLNSLLPHQLAEICTTAGCKLVHFSTDCVFDGALGGYTELDTSDADDLYGRSKYLGEVDYDQHLTLRTSIIGHEISGHVSLVDWFLRQEGSVKGFVKAIFSGLPTVHVAQFLHDHVVNGDLCGLYHLSADPIDKYSLLSLIKSQYSLKTAIDPCAELIADKSLNSDKLRAATGFSPPPWEVLVSEMFQEYRQYFKDR